MPRTTAILVSLLVILLIAGGVWIWFNRENLTPTATPTNTTTTNNPAVVNTNPTANLNVSLPTEIKGDKEMSGQATVAGVTLSFTSATKATTFEGEQAPDKKAFVAVYFEPVDGTKVLPVKDGLNGNHRLVTNKGNAEEAGMKIASSTVQGDRGYIRYLVAADATSFTLEIGPVASPERIPVPL